MNTEKGASAVVARPGGEVLHGALVREDMTVYSKHPDEVDLTTSYYRLPARARLTRHIHDERTEVWFLVAGSALVEIDEGVQRVVAPCAVITPPRHSHAMTAEDDDVVFAAFATPAVRTDADGNRLGTTELE